MMLKNNKGQTLYYFLIFTMILVLSWAMMLNIAKLIRDRMVMQNTADNIALSIATHKARTMNIVAGYNYFIGITLALGTDPLYVQIPSYNTDKIAAYPTGDTARQWTKKHADVKKMKKAVEGLQKAQDLALESHLAYINTLIGHYNAKGYGLTVSPYKFPTLANAQQVFGLERNDNPIKYLYTYNGCFLDINIVFNPTFLTRITDILSLRSVIFDLFGFGDDAEPTGQRILDMIRSGNFIDTILNTDVFEQLENTFFLGRRAYATSPTSWYVSTDNIYKQKIKVNFSDDNLFFSSSNNYTPLFSRLINIARPVIITRSAASIYNTQGTMFPGRKGKNTGIPNASVLLPLEGLVAGKFLAFAGSLYSKDPTKLVASAFVAYVGANMGRNIAIAKADKNNPIDAYLDSKKGGWAAHLVPYGTHQEEDENEDGSG